MTPPLPGAESNRRHAAAAVTQPQQRAASRILAAAAACCCLSTLVGATVSFASAPNPSNILAVRSTTASTSGAAPSVDEYFSITPGQTNYVQTVSVTGCLQYSALTFFYGSLSANGNYGFFPCGTSAQSSRVIVRIDPLGNVDTSSGYSGLGSYVPRGATSSDGTNIWTSDGLGVFHSTFGSSTDTYLTELDYYYGSYIGNFNGQLTLVTTMCTNGNTGCTGSIVYDSVPLSTSSTGGTPNVVMQGISLGTPGQLVVMDSFTIYVGGDETNALGGLYKWTGTTGTVSGSWTPYQWGTGGYVKNPVGDAGVHGLGGRFESGNFILYLSSSKTNGNTIYRYDTSQDGSTLAGSGYTALAVAPVGNMFTAVFPVPAPPSSTPTNTPSPSQTPSKLPQAAVSSYTLSSPVLVGGVAMLDTAGTTSIVLNGSALGAITTVSAPSAYTFTMGSVIPLGAASQTVCWVSVANTQVTCNTVPGVGANLPLQLYLNNRPVYTVPLTVSYAPPVATSVSSLATSLPTAGGSVLTIAGSYFGPPGTSSVVSFGPTGVEYTCAVTSNTQSLLTCTTGPSAGTNLGVTLNISGQLTSVPPSLFNFSCLPPSVRTVTAGTGVNINLLSTQGGQSITINGTNFGGVTTAPLAVTLVSAATGASIAVTSCARSPVSPSTLITCITPGGVGKGLRVNVTSGGLSPVAPLGGTTVSFSPATVTSVVAVGASPTLGGVSFSVFGVGFGPGALATPPTTVDFALYGANASLVNASASNALATLAGSAAGNVTRALQALPPGVYIATSCRISSDTQLACITGPGVGHGLWLVLSVGGQLVTPYPAGLAYAAPQISNVAGGNGVGTFIAATTGGQAVNITGTNFGPSDAYTASLLSVTYSAGGVAAGPGSSNPAAGFTYVASGCIITSAHTQITCNTVVGGGVGLAWSVSLAGAASTYPTINYAPPTITNITQPGGRTPVTAANPLGGDLITLIGSGFGPASFYNSSRPMLSVITYGPTGYEYTVPPASIVVTSDGVATFITVPGTGSSMLVFVTVAGQTNAFSPTFAYAAPIVEAVYPAYGPTDTAGTIVLAVSNVPFLDQISTLVVCWGANGGSTVLAPTFPVPRTPAALNSSTNGDGSVNISVTLPPNGAGSGIPITLNMTQAGRVVSSGPASPSAVFSYLPPVITSITAVHPTPATAGAGTAAGPAGYNPISFPCPFSASAFPAFVPSIWSCTPAIDPTLLLVTVVGSNFGANDAASGFLPDGISRGINLTWATNTSTTGASGATINAMSSASWTFVNALGPSPASGPLLYRVFWSDTLIQFLTGVPSGQIQVSVGSVAWNGAAMTQSTPPTLYSQGAPSILSSTGATTNIPTAGSPLTNYLQLSVGNVANEAWIQIMVGGKVCPFLPMVGGLCSTSGPVIGQDNPDIPSLAAAIALNVLNATAQGTPSGGKTDIVTVCCVPPAGQGTQVPVQLLVYSTVLATPVNITSNVYISYAPPTMTNVQVMAPSGTYGAPFTQPYVTGAAPAPIILPTLPTSVQVTGTNLGVSPSLTTGDYAVTQLGYPGTPCPGTEGACTCFQFMTPSGEGTGHQLGNGSYATSGGYYPFQVLVGNQNTAMWAAAYAPPTVTSITSASGAFPTRGNVTITLNGVNFGFTPRARVSAGYPDTVPLASFFLGASAGADPGAVNESCTRLSQTAIACQLPEGAGSGLSLTLGVAGLSTFAAGLLSYDAPNISAAMVTMTAPGGLGTPDDGALLGDAGSGGLPIATGSTTGGSVLILVGSNFGPGPWWVPPFSFASPSSSSGNATSGANGTSAAASSAGGNSSAPVSMYAGYAAGVGATGYCAFLSWAAVSAVLTSAPVPPPTCDATENFVGEGELPWGNIIAWTHESITLITPPGAGTKEIALSVRNTVTTVTRSTTAPTWTPGEPVASPDVVPWRFRYAGPNITGVTPSVGGTTAGGDYITVTGTNFGPPARNTTQLSQELTTGNAGSNPSVSLGLPLVASPGLPSFSLALLFGAQCMSDSLDGLGTRHTGLPSLAVPSCLTLVSHSPTTLVFQLPAGIGANISVGVALYDAPGAPLFSQNSSFFSYSPPSVTMFDPNPVTLYGAPVPVGITGINFGDPTQAGTWTSAQKTLLISVGSTVCDNPARTTNTLTGATGLSCFLEANTTVGTRSVSLTVAGQTAQTPAVSTPGSSFAPLMVVCGVGWFGRIGETCAACPTYQGLALATCAGYNGSVAIGTLGGLLFNPLDARNPYPVPQPGYYSLSRTYITPFHPDGSPANATIVNASSACPPQVAATYPGRDTCVVGCRPAAACLGGNVCAPGYMSVAPYYGCGACAPTFYSRDGACVACPPSSAAVVVALLVLVVVLGGAAYALNNAGVMIGCISTGIDMFQVMAVLASTQTPWPTAVTSLLYVLSSLNLNIELLSPECIVFGATFTQKYIATLLLPIALSAILLGLHFGAVAFKFLQGRTKKLHRNLPMLISVVLVLFSFLYLDVTLMLLQPFNCVPATPPDGRTYLAVNGEPCGVAGGAQLTLLPWSVAGVIVYTIGYPVLLAVHWWKNRELVMEDQLLRAKGTGYDRLSNPAAYELRKSWGRTYAAFRPDCSYWAVLLLLRKSFIAGAIVAFNQSAAYQLAACQLVMLIALGIQVFTRPYMGRENYAAELANHAALAATSPLHARLEARLHHVEMRGRRRSLRNAMSASGRIDVSAAVAHVRTWLTDNNTIETVLQVAFVLVCLLGLLFTSGGNGAYSGAGNDDALTSLTLAVIIISILYVLGVVIAEGVAMWQQAAAEKAALKSGTRSKSANKGVGSSPSLTSATPPGSPGLAARAGSLSFASSRGGRVGGAGPEAATMEQGYNPLLVSPTMGSMPGGVSAASLAAVASGPAATDAEARQQIAALRQLLSGSPNEVPSSEHWALVKAAYARTADTLEHSLSEVSHLKHSLATGGGGDPSSDSPQAGGRHAAIARAGGVDGVAAIKKQFAPTATASPSFGAAPGGSPKPAASRTPSLGSTKAL